MRLDTFGNTLVENGEGKTFIWRFHIQQIWQSNHDVNHGYTQITMFTRAYPLRLGLIRVLLPLQGPAESAFEGFNIK